MAKIVLDDVAGGYNLTNINSNFQRIEDELNNKVLYRDPEGEPNTLDADLDANGKRIYNLPEPIDPNEAARLQDVQNAISGATSANLISFAPYENIAATTVQGAIQEMVDDLAGPTGSSLVGFIQNGVGAVPTTVQATLRHTKHPSEYNTNINYVDAAKTIRTGEIFAENGSIIHRMSDRLLLADAIDCTGDNVATGTSWLGVGPQPGLGWVEKNATFASFASKGSIGVAGAARTSQMTGGASIGLIGVGYNNNTVNTVHSWGAYIEGKGASGHLGTVWGAEIDIATLGTYVDSYAPGANKTFGLGIGAGADPAINGVTDSVTLAVNIFSNGSTFGRGISFGGGSLRNHVDAEGLNHFKAIVLRNSQQIGWEDGSGNSLGFLRSNVTAQANETSVFLSDNNIFLRGTAGNKIAQFAHTASAVNFAVLINAAATASPAYSVGGTDANIDVRFVPKGTGVVRFGTFTVNADAPITGYITIKDSGGVVRKLATIA